MRSIHRSAFVALTVCLLVAVGGRATEVHYLDLYQEGSSAIIIQQTTAGKKIVLVDTGKQSADVTQGGGRVLQKLADLGIDHIDVAIFSHLDADHFGGYRNLLGLIPTKPTAGHGKRNAARGPPAVTIGAVIEPGFATDANTYRKFLADLTACRVEHVTPANAKRVRALEATFRMKLFTPKRPTTKNASSILVRIDDVRTQTSHLLTGDTTPSAWNEVRSQLEGKKIEVITAPHHGGDRVLLDLVHSTRPERVVIQVNSRNRYRHPNLRLMRDLARLGVSADLRAREDLTQKLEAQDALIIRFSEAIWNNRDLRPPPVDLAYTYPDQFGPTGVSVRFAAEYLSSSSLGEALTKHERTFHGKTRAMQKSVLANGSPLPYEQLLLTSERGDITISPAGIRTVHASEDPFLEEALWYRARYLSDEEISRLGTWPRAREYLTLLVREDMTILRNALAPAPSLTPSLEKRNAAIRDMVLSRPDSVISPYLVDLHGPRDVPSAIACLVGGRSRIPVWSTEYERIVRFFQPGLPDRQVAQRLLAAARRLAAGTVSRSSDPEVAALFEETRARLTTEVTERNNWENWKISSIVGSTLRGLESIHLPDADRLNHEAPHPFVKSRLLFASDLRQYDPFDKQAAAIPRSYRQKYREAKEREATRKKQGRVPETPRPRRAGR